MYSATSSLKLRKSFLILQMNTKKNPRLKSRKSNNHCWKSMLSFFTFLPSRLLTTCLPIHHPTTITNLTHFLQDLALLRHNSSAYRRYIWICMNVLVVHCCCWAPPSRKWKMDVKSGTRKSFWSRLKIHKSLCSPNTPRIHSHEILMNESFLLIFFSISVCLTESEKIGSKSLALFTAQNLFIFLLSD